MIASWKARIIVSGCKRAVSLARRRRAATWRRLQATTSKPSDVALRTPRRAFYSSLKQALRAAYLAARGYRNVTLMLPWLADVENQAKIYGGRTFETSGTRRVPSRSVHLV